MTQRGAGPIVGKPVQYAELYTGTRGPIVRSGARVPGPSHTITLHGTNPIARLIARAAKLAGNLFARLSWSTSKPEMRREKLFEQLEKYKNQQKQFRELIKSLESAKADLARDRFIGKLRLAVQRHQMGRKE